MTHNALRWLRSGVHNNYAAQCYYSFNKATWVNPRERGVFLVFEFSPSRKKKFQNYQPGSRERNTVDFVIDTTIRIDLNMDATVTQPIQISPKKLDQSSDQNPWYSRARPGSTQLSANHELQFSPSEFGLWKGPFMNGNATESRDDESTR